MTKGIFVKDFSFAYPELHKKVLKNINFYIQKGKKGVCAALIQTEILKNGVCRGFVQTKVKQNLQKNGVFFVITIIVIKVFIKI